MSVRTIRGPMPPSRHAQAARHGGIFYVWTVALFALAAMVINFGSVFRLLAAAVLVVLALAPLVNLKLLGPRLLNIAGLFGFVLLGTNLVFKHHTIGFSDQIAGVEFITPGLAIFLIAATYLSERVRPEVVHRGMRAAVWMFLLVCLVDLALRLQNAGLGCFSLSSGCRFDAKMGGLAFNANIVAVPIIACLFFVRSLRLAFLFMVLLYFTMNRSGIFAVLPALGILVLFGKDIPLVSGLSFGVRLLVTLPLMVVPVMDVLPLVVDYVFNDGSFLSKINFVDISLRAVASAPSDVVIFGDRLDYEYIIRQYSYNGWSLHLAILKAFWYFGLFGVAFYVILNIGLMRLSLRAACCALAYILMGISGFAIFNPAMLTFPLFIKAMEHEDSLEAAPAPRGEAPRLPPGRRVAA